MGKLAFKEGVSLKGLQPQMIVGLLLAKQIFDELSLDTVVTSGNDSTHMKGSLHYKGLALDLRTKQSGRSQAIANAVNKLLKPLGFDVILEALGGDNEHLHLEHDVKEAK